MIAINTGSFCLVWSPLAKEPSTQISNTVQLRRLGFCSARHVVNGMMLANAARKPLPKI